MKRVVALLLLLLIVPLTAQAQSGAWSPPQAIETNTPSNWFPSIAVDPWDDVHLVWSSGSGEGQTAQDLLMYAQRHAGQWQAANDVIRTGTGGWAARNSIAVDRTGRLHLLVRSRDHILYTSARREAAGSAHGWTPPHVINGIGEPYYAALAIDSTGVLHAVWQELAPENNRPCNGCSDLWYRQSADGGAHWSAPRVISDGQAGSIKPQLVIDAGDNLYVTWDEGKDPNALSGGPRSIGLVASRDGGRTWSEPQRLEDGKPQQAALAIDGQERLVQVFRETRSDAIMYRTSQDQGQRWTEPAPLPGLVARNWNDTPWDRYALATDSAGNVHLIASARRAAQEQTPNLYHVTWDAQQRRWSEPEVIVTNDLYPEWPQAVIANGNQLHITWFTRSKDDLHDSDNQRYHVWYSTRTVDAPEVAVQGEAPPPPQPSATPTPQPTATSVVPLDPAVANAPLPTSMRTESPLLHQLGMAIVPALALSAAVLVIALRRRFA